MENTISTATPEPATETTPETTGASGAANGNGQTDGQAGTQGATDQTTFIPEGTNLDSLPQQVRDLVKKRIDEINRNMVRGFTEKTMKLSEMTKAEVAKATEALKPKAEFYDQFTRDEKLVNMYNDYVRQAEAAENQGNPTAKIEEKLKVLETQIRTREMSEVIDAFSNAENEKGEKVNADFGKFDSLIIGEAETANGKNPYSLLRAAVELAPGNTPQEKLANGYKAAKVAYDSIFQEGVKTGKGQMQRKSNLGSIPPSSGGKTLNIAPHRPKNALEALQMAREGIVVPRD